MKTIERIVEDLKEHVADQDTLITQTVSQVTHDYLEKYRVSDDGAAAGGNNKDALTGYGSDLQTDNGVDRF